MFLPRSLAAWTQANFAATLQQELIAHTADLPLQRCLSYGNYVSDQPITIMVHHCSENESQLMIKIGILYYSIIAGCSCTDDPTPMSELNEMCELILTINKTDAKTAWQII